MSAHNRLKIRRALFTVSDKAGVAELAKAMEAKGAEIVATGRTALVLKEAGVAVTPIEAITGNPEAFQGRMKTLSYQVCSGILYRRGDPSDESDLAKQGIRPVDCVVVNFYPFEEASTRAGITRKQLIEEVDIGGPTLVRAAAKNAPDVLVLTDPAQYAQVIAELGQTGMVEATTAEACAARAWERVYAYDRAIASELGERKKLRLRYGENPHQNGYLEIEAGPDSPIAWPASQAEALTPSELSYNNILDLSSAYALASDLIAIDAESTGVVIVKHNNPCGVAMVRKGAGAQKTALLKAWDGDPVSAFGGVLVFTDALEETTAAWLAEKFVELVAAPSLSKASPSLLQLMAKRRNLKAVGIRRFGAMPKQTAVAVPGGILHQGADTGIGETLKSMTRAAFPAEKQSLARFGVAVCRSLKSNAIALVREIDQGFQLVGAGQGQPNRIEALQALAVPRARKVLGEASGAMGGVLMVSDAFFPFRDTVDAAFQAGIKQIVQPGGSIKDSESIAACDEHGMAMAFTGVRHFRH